MLKWLDMLIVKTNFFIRHFNKLTLGWFENLDISELKKLSKILIIVCLIVLNPVIANSAEILQIKSSNTILVGDQNRNLTIGLFCVDVNETDELEATNLLKSEFPRGSKVKIKPFGFKENVLLAKVFNIKGTKEMTELLVAKDLISEICTS